VTRVEGRLIVTGDRRHTAQRVSDYLRAEARKELSIAVSRLTRQIGRPASRITIRDPRTRWGSCSSNGNLSFSWRLIMAPISILTYVAAHEVAHLREANHGPRFWALVGELHPSFREDRQELKRLAFDLNRYGGPINNELAS
ncbi:MAG: M48 family metallopeptidase, partial [Pseudomonadota bacterium]